MQERANEGAVARIAGVMGTHRARPEPPRGKTPASATSSRRWSRRWPRRAVHRLGERRRSTCARPGLASHSAELMLMLAERRLTGVFHCCGRRRQRDGAGAQGSGGLRAGPRPLRSGPPEPAALSHAPIPYDTSIDARATGAALGATPHVGGSHASAPSPGPRRRLPRCRASPSSGTWRATGSTVARPAPAAARPSPRPRSGPRPRRATVTRYAASDRELFEEHLASLDVPVTALQPRLRADSRSTTTAIAEPCAWKPSATRGRPATSSRSSPASEWVTSPAPAQRLPARDPRRAGCLRAAGVVRRTGPRPRPARRRDGGRRRLRPRAAAAALGAQAGGGRGEIVAGGRFEARHAARLGVPEILLTLGSEGAILYLGGGEDAIPVTGPVLDVQTTGAGYVFMVAYTAARSDGEDRPRRQAWPPRPSPACSSSASDAG